VLSVDESEVVCVTEEVIQCTLCEQTAQVACGACLIAWYCSVKCQLFDWIAYHHTCCPSLLEEWFLQDLDSPWLHKRRSSLHLSTDYFIEYICNYQRAFQIFKPTNLQQHGFCDSSERAYRACIYMRSTDVNKKTPCELLCSTSKVAPLKQLTIPRLELCAATLLSKLYKKAMHALNVTVNESYLWTDSSIVLT